MEVVLARIANLVGAITANVYMLLIIAMFTARILGWFEIGHWIGIASSLVLIPLIYLFVVGLKTDRRMIYFVWLVLMILFSLFELIFDDILKVDFRSVLWAVVPYVMFCYANHAPSRGEEEHHVGYHYPLYAAEVNFEHVVNYQFKERK